MPVLIRRLLKHHAWIATGLALIVFGSGVIWGSHAAAGADAYGYVSQADLWLGRDLFIDQSFTADVPWPFARWAFTPLGYRPEPDGSRIVPVYAPGLPLLMAGAKAAAGQCAMFLVVPLAGGLLVLATYWIGRRIGRPIVGLAASWIVATSPAMLFMLMAQMSDVPAAAAWAVAIACLLVETPRGAAAAGAATAVAILVRPNLAPLAVLLALWIAGRDLIEGRRREWRRFGAPWFVILASAGPVAIALVNARLYGSPMNSGYGDLSDAFAASYVLPNLRRYVTWLVSAETPVALAGLLCLAVPTRRLWCTDRSRRALWLLMPFAASVWVSYLLYVEWDAWWYLRFLLPSWPLMALGTASLLAAAYRSRVKVGQRVAVGLLFALGVTGVDQAVQRGALSEAHDEAKYMEVAKVVESLTNPDDVIISEQHSGSLRYYAGRLTLRWDWMDPNWLDRAVEWLNARGHHVYLVLEEWEARDLRARSASVSAIGRLDWMPLVSFRGGSIRLYDAIQRDRTAPPVPQPESLTIPGCLPQRPPPRLGGSGAISEVRHGADPEWPGSCAD